MVAPLFVDVYAGDVGGRPNWSLLASLGPPWHGAIVKATEGVHYAPSWFDVQWKQLLHVVPERYGVDWFRGAYHFLRFDVSGTSQAIYYLHTIARAGGWKRGDLWPIVDVELGSPSNRNQLASAQQIVDCTSAFAERIHDELGRDVMLYGNGAMRERGIRSRMACQWIWCPRYTPTLPRAIYERAGWTLDELVLWQYSGDGESYLADYPSSPPGFGDVDVSVLVHEGGIEWLRSQLWAEDPAG